MLSQMTINQVKGLMNKVKSFGNPQMMLNQMMCQNPQVRQAMDIVQQNGGDAKSVFYKLAKENGVNPDDIINQLMN